MILKFRYESIKEAREEIGLSQEGLMVEIAKRTNRTVSRPTIDKWENGCSRPDVGSFLAMKDIFRKPIKFFCV